MWREVQDLTASTVDRGPLGIDELGIDLPAGRDGLLDEDATLDDERALVPTSAAAPDQAPQSLDVRVLVAVLIARLRFARIAQARAAFAASTSLPNASMS